MSKRVITTVLSAGNVAAILAQHLIAAKQIELVQDSQVEAEMLACFEKDGTGGVGITQYRIEVIVDEAKESWRG